jgi:hypothetical protein
MKCSGLREYLLKGGFLWVDDFWGTPAWEQWSSQIGRVLPDYLIQDVPPDHPILHERFQIDQIPAGHEHQLLAPERRRDVGAWRGQPCMPSCG